MDQAQIVSWMNFADNEILPASCTWVFPCLGIMQFNKGATERAKEDVKKALSALNSHLLTHTYLVGERITLADITVTCTLLHLYQYVLEASFRKPFQNVNRWFTTMINQPQVKAIIGDFKLCEKMAQFDNKKFAEIQGKLKGGSADKKQDKKQEKKQEKKADKPKEVKKEESPAPAPAAKPKDPWMPFQMATLTWMTSSASTPTMMKKNLSHISGRTLTKKITQFGTQNTSTLKTFPRSS